MGKNEDEQVLSSFPSSAAAVGNGAIPCGRCRSIAKIASLRCFLMVVVGVAVFLSAAFWLLPFVGRGRGDLDPDPQFRGAYVVASFRVQKPVSMLNANIEKLRYDIFEEIGIPNTTVAVISLEPLGRLNWTNVVFGIWPDPKSTISSTWLSILRRNFVDFVIQQTTLHLTASLFGRTFFFQVLKFPGGITIIPQQNAFLLQKVDMLFNFTLNFPINKVEDKLSELKDQMKAGLLLNSYENLYVSLTNLNGSTVAPPTVVRTFVVVAVGNRPPSVPRLRQLAQTIRSSSDGNLGLNHTVFGRVKQIQLSSFLKHSLNGGGNGISIPPSPAPQPQVDHHHHHHHHRHHHSAMDLAPAPSPQHMDKSPAPSPQHMDKSPAPSGCPFVSTNKPIVPAAAPVESPESVPAPSPNEDLPALPPDDPPGPSPVEVPPAPAPHQFHTPLPHVFLAHARSPSKSATVTKPPEIPSFSPSPISSSVADRPFAVCWILVAIIYLLAQL